MTHRQNHLYAMISKTSQLRSKMILEDCTSSEELVNIARAFLNEAGVILVTAFGEERATEMLSEAVDQMRSGDREVKTISEHDISSLQSERFVSSINPAEKEEHHGK